MNQRTPILSLLILGSLLLTAGGCSSRQSAMELGELRADNERLTGEITALSKENIILAEQRDKARAENQRLRNLLTTSEKKYQRLDSTGLPKGMSTTDTGSIAMNSDFAFQKGSATLNTEASNSIRQLASLLNSGEYADTIITIQGHTDSTPVVRASTKSKFGNNWGLSAMRSAAVVTALEKAGIRSSRIRGSFAGEHAPRTSNSNKDGKAANRRVEIFLRLP